MTIDVHEPSDMQRYQLITFAPPQQAEDIAQNEPGTVTNVRSISICIRLESPGYFRANVGRMAEKVWTLEQASAHGSKSRVAGKSDGS
jgi:hypothetical protein